MERKPEVGGSLGLPIRQGDVILVPASKVEGEEKPLEPLAYGELTGHQHTFITPDAVKLFKFNDKTYIKVIKSAKLAHGKAHELREIPIPGADRHKTLEIPEGEYEVRIQKQHTPEGWKRVID